jgi:hypothetical protein
MTYFSDLSEYTYVHTAIDRPAEMNIGWLGIGHNFEKQEPSKQLLDLTWKFCSVSVSPTRGIHQCEFCSRGDWYICERNGQRLILGGAEIRVFSRNGATYAAPDLIYHYVLDHHYRPPDEFVQAMNAGLRPPDSEYFERLNRSGHEWRNKSFLDANWDLAMAEHRELRKKYSGK